MINDKNLDLNELYYVEEAIALYKKKIDGL